MPLGKTLVNKTLDVLYAELDRAQLALNDHNATHKRVYDQGAKLRDSVEIAQAKLTSLVRQQYASKERGEYQAFAGHSTRIVVTVKAKRTVDVPALLRFLPQAKKLGLVSDHVDLKKFDALVEDETITPEIVKEVVTFEPATPAISFKPAKETE